MRSHLLFSICLSICLFSPASFSAQTNDCVGATRICGDVTTTFNPIGIGVDDFADPDNMTGCLSTEHNSVWYTVTFDNTVPPGGVDLAFIISSGGTADYDFALYGPVTDCGNLGSPIRCSFAGGTQDTGLEVGEVDNSTGNPDFDDGDLDDVVSELSVNAGESYILIVDNWSDNGNQFDITFSGGAEND